MPLPLTVSCFSKILIGFAFQVPAHPGSPGKRAVKRVCVVVRDYLGKPGTRKAFCCCKGPLNGVCGCVGVTISYHTILFHNRRYHLQTLLTLPWLPYTSFLPSFSLPSFSMLPAPTYLPPLSPRMQYAHTAVI